MGFNRKYNTILKTIDNVVKLYKIAKKKDEKSKEDENENNVLE